MPLERLDAALNLDPRRVLLRPYGNPASAHGQNIIGRVQAMADDELSRLLRATLDEFGHRHPNVPERLLQRFEQIREHVPDRTLSEERKQMLGAVFSCEYSVEAAALFNPSIVAHPDQSGLQRGELRFLMSLRCTGEGHISSIGFRTGVIDDRANVRLDPPGRYTVESGTTNLNERVLFPSTEAQRNGIEDARFVRCEGRYYGTFTAYDGRQIEPQLVETDDFQHFEFVTLTGKAVKNKGMALFPRKIDGRFASLGRQDGESHTLMFSQDLHHWDEAEILVRPRFPWELVQVGNCGSPLETDQGWLVLTHGVGPIRRYCIGAFLLDKDDPSQVLKSLEKALIEPDAGEREGYVPNVVYSCGSILHAGHLIIPYAMSDSACRFARIPLDELLDAMS